MPDIVIFDFEHVESDASRVRQNKPSVIFLSVRLHGCGKAEGKSGLMAVKKKSIAFDPEIFLTRIGSGRTIEKFSAHDIVYSQGDAANSIFYIQKGKCKETVTSKSGKEAVLALLGPADFFGESCLHGHPRRITTVTAMTECSVMRLEKLAMLRVLSDEPAFSEKFILYLLRRNDRTEEALTDQLFNYSEKRLARTLLLLANFGKDSKPEPVIPKINQETLAEMIGTTRSRVSFFMNKFRRLGFIEYSGGIHSDLHVNTSLLNMVLHDSESNGKR
jgi:CRP/FNR family cyclic AMP-dependent transcriptional regulator